MRATATDYAHHDGTPTEDHFVHLYGATWEDYERLLEIRGDRSAPRIAYLEGVIEITSPSRTHEGIKSWIGRLVEVYCLVAGVEFSPFGSWTQKKKAADRGAEPDECYVFGDGTAEVPHLAIEVIWTSGGLDKLQIYRLLDVAEVWIWKKGRIDVYVLSGDHYLPSTASRALPGIDLTELASYLDRPTASQAMREYRVALEARA